MLDFTLKLLPVIASFALGLGMKQIGVWNASHADRMLRIVVNVGLPLLILASISRINLQSDLLRLPLFSIVTCLIVWPVAYIIAKRLHLSDKQAGSFITGPMIMNIAFLYPFILAFEGESGFAYLALLDFGNGLIVLTLVYSIACWYGKGSHLSYILHSLASFPPFWALLIALALNISNIHFTDDIATLLIESGRWLMLLVVIAIGIYFDPRLEELRITTSAIAVRVGIGCICALLWVDIFQIESTMRNIIIVTSIAPIGFNTVVFAERQHLDKALAANMVSLSILLGILYIPILLLFIH